MDELSHWVALHDGEYKTELPPAMAKSWDISYSLGVNPDKEALDIYAPQKYLGLKEQFALIFIYANRAANIYLPTIENKDVAIALFDDGGCLMRLYGSKFFLSSLDDMGISRWSKWDIASSGANAVSLGFSLNQTVTMSGAQNFCKALMPVHVCFSPFSVVTNYLFAGAKPLGATEQYTLSGGVALIYRDAQEEENCHTMSTAMIREIATHLFFVDILSKTLPMSSEGALVIDKDISNGEMTIINYNQRLFSVLEIPQQYLFAKKIAALIDPGPVNQELWDIISREQTKREHNIDITVQGVRASYIVSLIVQEQPGLRVKNIHLFFDTEKRINQYISTRIGNNARMSFQNIIGRTPVFLRTVEHAKLMAQSDSNILILGESGVGKDLFAQAIHNASKRRNGPFIVVNCGALPRELIVSELFGYVAGSFTGSKKGGNIGKFELANTGTIFLDEIGDMPLDLQVMLLRVIENKSFMRLGGTRETSIDVKIISATNSNLVHNVEQKRFREDLYFRLSTLQINIPSLRDRPEDIVFLSEHFLQSSSKKLHVSPPALSESAKALLKALPWKGNVRELQNLFEYLSLAYAGEVIEPKHINSYMNSMYQTRNNIDFTYDYEPQVVSGDSSSWSRKIPKQHLESVLLANRFNKSLAAKELGVSRKTLYRWMKEHNLE